MYSLDRKFVGEAIHEKKLDTREYKVFHSKYQIRKRLLLHGIDEFTIMIQIVEQL